MRILIQRVKEASVRIDGELISLIYNGLLIFVGIEEADEEEDAEWLAKKSLGLRIFNDAVGVMNRSVQEIEGEILAVSQFTLMAATKKGNRPSYIRAAGHEKAIKLYEYYCNKLQEEMNKPVKRGVFGADMQVGILNDGPVTIWIDSKNRE